MAALLQLVNIGKTAVDVRGLDGHCVHMAAEVGKATVQLDFFAPGTILPPGVNIIYNNLMFNRIPGGKPMKGDHPHYPSAAEGAILHGPVAPEAKTAIAHVGAYPVTMKPNYTPPTKVQLERAGAHMRVVAKGLNETDKGPVVIPVATPAANPAVPSDVPKGAGGGPLATPQA